MKFPDEALMAYADGELDAAARAEIEAAIATDPEVARAVERHRSLAARLHRAYDCVLDEPVPNHLSALATKSDAARGVRATRPWLPAWAAAAASLVAGLVLGNFLARTPDAPFEEAGGVFVARGTLEAALTSRLAAASAESGVAIGITFRNREGAYCRTFDVREGAPLSGLACRSGQRWAIEALAAAPSQAGELRPAATMPLPVLHAVDAAIDGEPLDAAAEAAARDTGWRSARNVAE